MPEQFYTRGTVQCCNCGILFNVYFAEGIFSPKYSGFLCMPCYGLLFPSEQKVSGSQPSSGSQDPPE